MRFDTPIPPMSPYRGRRPGLPTPEARPRRPEPEQGEAAGAATTPDASALPSQNFGDWLASMSHELRTPLSSILGYADLLLLGLPREIPDESKAQVDRMRLAARHLLHLLDEILTFARVEAGQESVRREPLALNALVRETGAQLERQLSDRPVKVVVSLPDMPLIVATDEAKLRLVLSHLGGHALGRTARGTVTLAAHQHEDGVTIEVRDTGAGIPAERLAHVFDPAWQGGLTSDAGAGLGLTLAALLTRLIGGDISVRSREGIGTTFAVRLPFGPVRRG